MKQNLKSHISIAEQIVEGSLIIKTIAEQEKLTPEEEKQYSKVIAGHRFNPVGGTKPVEASVASLPHPAHKVCDDFVVTVGQGVSEKVEVHAAPPFESASSLS